MAARNPVGCENSTDRYLRERILFSGGHGKDVLAMSYAEGASLDPLKLPAGSSRSDSNLAINLVLRELSESSLMQTDPNFANYRYHIKTQRLVLLDSGAVREFSPAITQIYRLVLRAGMASDRTSATRAALDFGLFPGKCRAHDKMR